MLEIRQEGWEGEDSKVTAAEVRPVVEVRRVVEVRLVAKVRPVVEIRLAGKSRFMRQVRKFTT